MEILKVYARSFYDFQEVKNEFAGRLRASDAVEKMPEERKKELESYRKQLEIAEGKLLKIIEPHLEEIPIYNEFLIKIKGCAVRMSACLLTSIVDIKRFATVSKLWAYSGLHVIEGRGAKRRKGEKANWNQFLKTKLYILSDCLLKLNFSSEEGEKRPLRYRKFYDDYKTRMENRASCSLAREMHAKTKDAQVSWLDNGCTKGHVHNMSLRYMQKMFLQDLWEAWWILETGSTPTRPYAEAVLGRKHGEYPKPIPA